MKTISTKNIQENYNKAHWRPIKDIQKTNKGNSKVQQSKSKSTTKDFQKTKKGKVSISFWNLCSAFSATSHSHCIDLEIKENPFGSGSNIWRINPEKKQCLGLKYRFPMHCIAMGWATIRTENLIMLTFSFSSYYPWICHHYQVLKRADKKLLYRVYGGSKISTLNSSQTKRPSCIFIITGQIILQLDWFLFR